MKVRFINDMEFEAALYDGSNGAEVEKLIKEATSQKTNVVLKPSDLVVKIFDQIIVLEHKPEFYDFEDFVEIVE